MPSRIRYVVLTLLCLIGFSALGVAVEKVEETWPNGKKKLRANKNDAGEWDGSYYEYDEDGKTILRGRYKDGKKDGKFTEKDYDTNTTKTTEYDEGLLDGDFEIKVGRDYIVQHEFEQGVLTSFNGVKVHPRPLAEVLAEQKVIKSFGTEPDEEMKKLYEEVLDKSEPPTINKKDPKGQPRFNALKRLMQYRAAVGVPWRELRLDDKLNAHADAGSKLLTAIGKGLTHTPPKPPSWSEEDYKFAYYGTIKANLHWRSNPDPSTIMALSVDGYMEDRGVPSVGHRRWCTNPKMGIVGFGEDGQYSSMTAHDTSGRGRIPRWTPYPAAGYMPVGLFGKDHCWSLTLSSASKSAKLAVRVFEIGEDMQPAAEPLPLDSIGNGQQMILDTQGMGVPWCLIFRPKGVKVEHDAMYLVEVDGIPQQPDLVGGKVKKKKSKKGGVTMSYVVHFIDPAQAETVKDK